MKNPAHWIVAAALLVVTASALLGARSEPLARLVSAEISVDGVVLLRSSTSDDGKPDADAVWDYLRRLRFETTDAFDPAEWKVGTSTLELHGTDRPGATADTRPRYERNVELAVSYGGTASLFELELLHVNGDPGGREWQVNPSVIERYFEIRRISRREARLLTKPKRTR